VMALRERSSFGRFISKLGAKQAPFQVVFNILCNEEFPKMLFS
jgi:hypothetical protein